MAYKRYEINITQALYSDYDKVRKNFIGDKLNREDIATAMEMCHIPIESPKIWNLLLKYEIILRFGKASGTYYMMPKDLPPYTRFEGIEREFYGSKPKKLLQKPVEREIERTPLTEEYCIEFLKKRNYVIFKIEPDFNKLSEILNPEFLLQNSKATLK